MKEISPSKEGRVYELWLPYFYYLAFALNQDGLNKADIAFRVTVITTAWMTIEAFTKAAMYNCAKYHFD